ncbi:Predicted Zn-dependent metalloprotease, SprT family [Nocardioides exalbidus]|uniref:Predicted Zn-dependent metalloprotease, SprT family n=1 Tax=Nocardioides exalbidus TaxID=402596 RepID=A0A1H4P8K8_9ACTN|nr:SprT-like domain-containing protein [Nocardioides exalbidus]SEC03770.1 Predicted Zn-dependent metalloprotease, SprT family [Nocardioides exalbidus]
MDLADARVMAQGLMAEHGLEGWRLVFDRAKTRAGVCRPGRREIGLSRPLTQLHPVDEVRDTVLHEIAHALVGPEHGHDAVWRATALRIGCSAERCVSSDVPRVEGGWVGTCPAGHRRTAHRRPERVTSCGACTPGRFDPAALHDWTFRGRPAPMHPNFVLELDEIRARAAGGSTRARSALSLGPGAPVRLSGGGRFGGLEGVVEARGRTRYRVRTREGLVSAPFASVVPLG